MTTQEMVAAYLARGGKVTRARPGKRNVPRGIMRDLTRDDKRRLAALAALDAYRKGTGA